MSPYDEPILQFFTHAHLPPDLRAVSRPFADLAQHLVLTLPRNPERTVALRKLLESKDCAVRALLYREPPRPPKPTVAELEAILNSEDKPYMIVPTPETAP